MKILNKNNWIEFKKYIKNYNKEVNKFKLKNLYKNIKEPTFEEFMNWYFFSHKD